MVSGFKTSNVKFIWLDPLRFKTSAFPFEKCISVHYRSTMDIFFAVHLEILNINFALVLCRPKLHQDHISVTQPLYY